MNHTISLPRPDDFHVHLRQDEALVDYTNDCAAVFGRALVMPNTIPPIRDAGGLLAYQASIKLAAKDAGQAGFEPLMTFKIFQDLTLADLQALKNAGAVAGKLYPQGATTNSNDGVANPRELWPVYGMMEELGLVLCLHGEDPKAYSMEREQAFLPVVSSILQDFPKLRVILEHVTTAEGITFVLNGPERLGATITVHHLLSNLDDMVGGHLNPHLFCKPILKSPRDQEALQRAALLAPSRIFFGSDSAPHTKAAKECDCGAAGVYSMPVAMPLLAGLFMDGIGRLEQLGQDTQSESEKIQALTRFVAGNGARFYGLPQAKGTMTLEKSSWKVPNLYTKVVPYMAGKTLEWRIKSCS